MNADQVVKIMRMSVYGLRTGDADILSSYPWLVFQQIRQLEQRGVEVPEFLLEARSRLAKDGVYPEAMPSRRPAQLKLTRRERMFFQASVLCWSGLSKRQAYAKTADEFGVAVDTARKEIRDVCALLDNPLPKPNTAIDEYCQVHSGGVLEFVVEVQGKEPQVITFFPKDAFDDLE